ncbi:helix-turn-helix transcriptional regulator [Methylocella tundrae]|nr:helix-turn-helix transcriptional regulator [Methylocella tundrae]
MAGGPGFELVLPMNQAKSKPMGTSKEAEELAAKIGAKIKELRLAKGFATQDSFAKKLGMKADGVSAYERGNNLIQLVKLSEMAQILGVTPNDILGFKPGSAGQMRQVTGILLERSCVALGVPEKRARALAETVLAVLDSPAIHTSGIPLEDIVRILADDAIRRSLLSARS